jgi:hypothetical protein
LNQLFRPRRDVRFRIIDGEAVVLRQEAGETLVLNEVGARVLSLIAEGHDLERASAALVAEFAVTPEVARADLEAFVTELSLAGVIEELPWP